MIRSVALLFVSAYFQGVDCSISESLLADTATYCANVTEDMGLTRNNNTLLQDYIGPVNLLDEIGLGPSCGSVEDCLSTYKDDIIGPAIRLGIPILLFLITIVLWFIFGCCACCRCCRQCSLWCCCKEKKFPSYFSRCTLSFIWSSFALVVVCAIVDAAYTGASLKLLHEGSSALMCRSFSLANDVLNGGKEVVDTGSSNVTISFIGTEPLYNELTSLEEMLLSNSSTVMAIEAVVKNTIDLDNALDRFSAYLELTQDMLGDPDTIQPKLSGSGEYQCVLCGACCTSGGDSYIDQLNTALSDSFAEALSAIRAQVTDTLTGSGLQDTQNAVSDAAGIVNNATERINDPIGQSMVDNASRADTGLKWLYIGLVILASLMALVILSFIIALVFGVARSYKISYSDPYDKPRNPCVASCGWCMSFLYAFLIFFVGAVLMIIGYAQASFCDSTYDLDSTIDKAFARYAPDLTNSSATVVLANSCLKSSSDGDFLTALPVGDTNARALLNNVTDISTLLDDAFNQTQSIPEISTLDAFVALTDSMAAYKSLYMIPADRIAALKQDGTLNVNAISDIESQAGYGSSGYCNSKSYDLAATDVGLSIQASLTAAGITLPNDLTLVSIPGVADYESATSSETGLSYTGTCSDLSVTKDSFNPFSSLLFWKEVITTKTNFKCNTIHETQDPDTNVITFSRVAATCSSQDEFDTYIDSLRTNLINAAATLDSAATSSASEIESQIAAIINDEVLPPVYTVLDNSNCLVLRNSFNAFYNTFCPNFTVGVIGAGITFVVFGGITLISIFVMFGIWRNLKDNMSLWKDLVKQRGDRQTAIRNMVNAVPAPAQIQIQPDTGYPPKRVR